MQFSTNLTLSVLTGFAQGCGSGGLLNAIYYILRNMYNWFSRTRNRLIYFTVFLLGHVSLLILSYFEQQKVDLLRSRPGNEVIYIVNVWPDLWLIYVGLLILVGIIFLLLATVRFFRKLPSKIYWWLGSVTIFLHVLTLVSLSFLNR